VSGNNLTGQKGDAANLSKLTINCSEFMDGGCYIGCSDGSVFNCKGSSMGKGTAIHAKGIDALTVSKEKSVFFLFTNYFIPFFIVSSQEVKIKP